MTDEYFMFWAVIPTFWCVSERVCMHACVQFGAWAVVFQCEFVPLEYMLGVFNPSALFLGHYTRRI